MAASLIQREQIACFYRNTGRFIAAPSKRVFDGLAHDLAMMREDGVPVDAEMVEPEAAPAVYRKGRYHAARSCAATARSTRASTMPACWSGPRATARRS